MQRMFLEKNTTKNKRQYDLKTKRKKLSYSLQTNVQTFYGEIKHVLAITGCL